MRSHSETRGIRFLGLATLGWAALCAPALGDTSEDAAFTPSARVADALDRYVFVANRTTAEIAMIDTEVDQVVGRISVGDVPHQYVLSETQAKLVVSHLDQGALTLFDLRAMAIETVLSLGFRPEQIEIDADGEIVAVAGSGDGEIALIALDNGRMTAPSR